MTQTTLTKKQIHALKKHPQLHLDNETIEKINTDTSWNPIEEKCHILTMDNNFNVSGIYVYGRGQLHHTGQILQDYYQDEPKIAQLMQLKSIYHLGINVNTPPILMPFGDCKAKVVMRHLVPFTKAQQNQINRGTIPLLNAKAIPRQSKDHYLKEIQGDWLMTNIYLYYNQTWFYRDNSGLFNNHQFKLLADALKELENEKNH